MRKTCVSAQEDEAELSPDEPSASRRDRESDARLARQRRSVRQDVGLDLAEQRSCRSASPRCGNVTTTRLPERTNPASSFSASASPRAAIAGRCASNWNAWPRGNGSSSAAPSSVDRREPFLGPHLPHLVGPAHEVGRVVDRGDEVREGRVADSGSSHGLGRQRELHQVAASLGRGIDVGSADRMQGPLGEGGERTHLLDLVAEQLDPKRFAACRREHVDDAAADGVLPAVVDPLDALVPGDGERLGEAVEARLVTDAQPHRPGPQRDGRHPFRKRSRGGADEPAGGEDVERAGALADEVRRRLETGRQRDAAARQQRDVLGADEPGRTLGRVPSVGVLGEQNEQRPSELVVERREQERQRRLRDAGSRRQRLDEGLKALTGGELRDEGVKGRRVHANGGNRPRRAIVATPNAPSNPPCPNLPRGHPRCPDHTVPRQL